MHVQIDDTIPRWARQNKELERQLPFAMALALTKTAADVRDELREQVGRSFVERSTWTRKGFKIKKATKRQLESTVGSRDEYLQRQVIGGKRGGHVPIGARRRPTDKTGPKKYPGALLGGRSSKRYYVAPLRKDGTGGDALWKIIGSAKNGRVQLMYLLKRKVRIKRGSFPWSSVVRNTARKRWSVRLDEGFREAFATAYKKR